MKPIFTVLKRQLASSSIPLALALLVMLLATSSASFTAIPSCFTWGPPKKRIIWAHLPATACWRWACRL